MAQKRIILITGCSTGIGKALAEAFIRNNDLVYATARNPETLKPLAALGAQAARLDVTDGENIKMVLARIQAEQGRLDLLVNNAGYATIGPLIEMPLTELRRQFDTNVIAPIALCQQALPLLRKSENGIIVNIGSVSGIFTTPFAGAYCATKSALHALSDALRMEIKPFGIQVVTVQPGAIRSDFGKTAFSSVSRNVPRNSLYASIMSAIHNRATASQDNPTPAEEFSQKLVEALNQKNPPLVIRIGYGSQSLRLMKRLIPERLLDLILAGKFSLNQLKITD